MNHRTPMPEWTLCVLPLRWCSFGLGCLEIGCIYFPFYNINLQSIKAQKATCPGDVQRC